MLFAIKILHLFMSHLNTDDYKSLMSEGTLN
jgi:hypothetical protein